MKLVLATKNKHKIKEIKNILGKSRIEILSMLDLPEAPDVKENKKTFRENAVKKAIAFAKAFSMPALADDSGLEIRYLKGQPGVRSARFAGPKATKEKLCKKVLRLMKDVPSGKRGARFVCNIAVALPEGKIRVVVGEVRGRIGLKMKGVSGFGYDPIFIPDGYNKTFAQMKPAAKDRLSHRGRALRKASMFLPHFLSKD